MTDSPGGMQAGHDLTVNQFGAPKYAMTDTQQSEVRDSMTAFAGASVTIMRVGSDPDVITYAKKLAEALKDANMNVDPQSAMVADAPPGLFFRYNEASNAVAIGLTNALTKGQLVQRPINGSSHGPTNLLIYVSPQR